MRGPGLHWRVPPQAVKHDLCYNKHVSRRSKSSHFITTVCRQNGSKKPAQLAEEMVCMTYMTFPGSAMGERELGYIIICGASFMFGWLKVMSIHGEFFSKWCKVGHP